MLERHHGVLLTDDAIEAALRLTDDYMLDRVRPDRAIDALDEACAHLQAKVTHSPRAETLIRERRSVLAARAAAEDARSAPNATRQRPPRDPDADPAGDGPHDEDDATSQEKLERYAREGIATLEKWGAEIESLFVEPRPQPIPTRPRAARPTNGARAGTAEGPFPPPASRLGEIEAELAGLLAADGAVVRGVDVARVVSRSLGQTVTWP